MKVKSLMRQHHALVPVEIELSLSPGLPQIIVLGLADTMIKESVLRIKSALKHQGFEWPRAQQILVHLKPSHLKKSSLGLDLAIAAALLWETGQLPRCPGDLILYGELSLKGEVSAPLDVARAATLLSPRTVLVSGEVRGLSFHSLQIKELAELKNPRRVVSQSTPPNWQRPPALYSDFSKSQADLIRLIAVGEHHALVAGPPGCGKTALAESIGGLLDEPTREAWAEQALWAQQFHQDLSWRPVVQTHHSIPPLSMLGGGSALRPGEITRAHGGVLIMDELLEFSPRVQEALREPLESGFISLARAGSVTNFPASFLLIGTTNLCPCGKFNYHEENLCTCRGSKRENYFGRLNGPFVDRFTIFKIMPEANSSEKRVLHGALNDEIQKAIEYRKKKRHQLKPNAKLTADELTAQFANRHAPRIGSQRRVLSRLRLARTLADLDGVPRILDHHYAEAKKWTERDFTTVQSYQPQTWSLHPPERFRSRI